MKSFNVKKISAGLAMGALLALGLLSLATPSAEAATWLCDNGVVAFTATCPDFICDVSTGNLFFNTDYWCNFTNISGTCYYSLVGTC